MPRALVFCAHSDDQAFGVGGTIATLAKQGWDITTIICSFGEQSHPHLPGSEIKRTRVFESKKADKILGGNGVMFLGLHEGTFEKEYRERNLHANIVQHIATLAPNRIFTHSSDDPHPDHRACHRILLSIHSELPSCDVYTFDVWNLANIAKRTNPRLVVDITPVFRKKIDALHAFKSQRHALAVLLWSVYVRAIFWGIRTKCRYAEGFYRVR